MYLRLHLHISEQNTHQRKNLKLLYLHCYTRNIFEICTEETLIY